jgi:hypothetical protein
MGRRGYLVLATFGPPILVANGLGLGHWSWGMERKLAFYSAAMGRVLLSPGHQKHGMMSDDDEGGYKCKALLLYQRMTLREVVSR